MPQICPSASSSYGDAQCVLRELAALGECFPQSSASCGFRACCLPAWQMLDRNRQNCGAW